MQKLLRTALLSVFALLVAGGLMAVQAQDASVTVDAAQGDEIADGLSELDNVLSGTSGDVTGELIILANDYRNEGQVDLSTVSNVDSLSIVATDDGGRQEVTIESFNFANSSISGVSFNADGGYVQITEEGAEDALTFAGSSGQTDVLGIDAAGTLRIVDGATVVREGGTVVADGSAGIQYGDGSGVPNLAFNTGSEDLVASAEFPSSGEISTLELDGQGSVTFNSGATVGEVTDGNSTGFIDAGLTVNNGDLTIQNTGLEFASANEVSVADGALDVQGGGVILSNGADESVSTGGALTVSSGGVTVSAGESGATDISVGGDLTVNGGGLTAGLPGPNVTVSEAENVEVSVSGAADVTGSVDATGSISVVNDINVGGGNVVASGTFKSTGGALTVDVADGTASTALSVSGGTVSSNGTTISGTGNQIVVSDAADVSLGDVSFAEPFGSTETVFNLSNLNADAEGVTTGDVDASFVGTTSGGSADDNTFDLVESDGFFETGTITATPVDPDDGTDLVADGSTANYTVAVEASNGDLDIGEIVVSEVGESDGTGAFVTQADLNVSAAGSDDPEGRILVSGEEFNAVDVIANGTIEVEGSGAGNTETTFTGAVGATNDGGDLIVEPDAVFQGAVSTSGTLTTNGDAQIEGSLTNSGTLDVNAGATYDRDAAGGAINNTGGQIDVADGQTFTIDATATGSDVLTGNSATGVTGDGTFEVETGDGITATIRGLDHGFPETQHTGSGTLEIDVNDGASGTSTGSVSFGGDLTAESVLEFVTSGDDNVSSISVSNLTASANVDFSPASYSGDGLSANDVTVTDGRLTLGSASSAANVTVQNQGELDIASETLSLNQDLTREDAPDTRILSEDAGKITVVGADDSTIDPGETLVTIGEFEVDKEVAEEITVTIASPLRVDGDVIANEPDNELVTTTVEFGGNLIIRDGAFRVARSTTSNPGTLTVNTGENALVFRGSGTNNAIDTDGPFEITSVTSRADGDDVTIVDGTDLTVTDTLFARSSGFVIEDDGDPNDDKNGADLSPGADAEVVRSVVGDFNSEPTLFTEEETNSPNGSFNGDGNTYNLTYRGDGSGQTAAELNDQNTQNLSLASTGVGSPTVRLDQAYGIAGTFSVGSDAELSKNSFDLTLSGEGAEHSVGGTVTGNGALVVAGANASVTGDASDANDAGSEITNLTVGASGVSVTDIQEIIGALNVNADSDLTLSLADSAPDENSADNDQRVDGTVTLDGTGFTLNADAEVTGDFTANSGEVAFGANDLLLTNNGNYTAEESVTYSADMAESADGRGELVLAGAATLSTNDTESNNDVTPADIPNVRVESEVSLGTNVGVSNWLEVNAGDDSGTPGIDLNGSELAAAENVILNATTTSSGNAPDAIGGSGTFDVSSATVQLASGDNDDGDLSAANQAVSTLTVSGNSEVAIASTGDATRELDVGGTLDLVTDTDGSLNVQGNTVSVDGFTVSDDGDGDSDGAASVASSGGYLAFDNSGLATSLARGATIDRLQVLQDAGLTSGDEQTLTVNDELWLNAQFDALSGDNSDDLAVADGVTIRRTEGSVGGALTEAPDFNGEVSLVYDRIDDGRDSDPIAAGQTPDFEAGPEVPASDNSNATIVELTVDVGPSGQIAGATSDGFVTFAELGSGVSSNPVTVTNTVDLESGYLEHGTDGSNDLRRLTLSDGAVFAQKNGKIEEYSGTTRDNIVASSYTLRYYPTASGLSTGPQEFLGSGAVTTLEFIDGPVESSSAADLDLHADRTVGSTLVDRSGTDSGTSEFDLSGNTLTASSTANIAAGEVSNSSGATTLVVNGTSGDLAENSDVRVNGTLSDALEAAGKTFVTESGSVTGDVTATGDVEVAGSLTSNNFVFAGDVIADAGTFNPTNVTAQGDSDQSVGLPGDLSVTSFTVNQTTPPGNEVPSVSVNNGNIDVSGSEGLDLSNGLLVTGENEVDLTSGGFVRNVDQAAGDTSHVVGAVRQSIDSDSRVRTTYPVGSADGSYRFYQLIFPNGISDADIVVSHVDENPGGTSGLPTDDETGVTIGSNYPDYYWTVQTEQNLGLTQNYEVAARANGLTFNSDQPVEDHRLIRRNDVDGSDWGVVGGGVDYNNTERSAEGEADIRTTSATGNLTTQGTRFTVGVPGTQAFNIAGSVNYPTVEDGSLVDGRSLGGVEVQATSSDTTAIDSTDSNGNFTISGLPTGEYTVTANVGDDPANVSTADALRTVRGFAGIDAFAGSFQEQVADVNGSGGVNATDALQIARFDLGLTDGFSVGSFVTESETVVLGDSSASGVELFAAEAGDVRLDGGETGGSSQTLAASTLSPEQGLSAARTQSASSGASEAAVEAGETFEVPVRMGRGAEVGAYQMTVNYDSDIASFDGVKAAQEGVLTNASEDGTVQVSWFDQSGESALELRDGSDLVTLQFTASEDAAETDFSPEVKSGEITGPDAAPISAGVELQAVSIGAPAPDEFALNGSYPNPVQGQATIEMDIPSKASVTVEVYNVLGQRVQTMEQSMSAGSGQTIQLDGSNLASGQYFYRVEADLEDGSAQKSGRITVVK